MPPSVQNPILREFFLKQYNSLHPPEAVLSEPDMFAEKYIDLRTAEFLEKVRENLDDLDRDRLLLKRVRDELGSETSDLQRRGAAGAANRLKENSNRLRRLLSMVFSELKSKQDYEPDPEDCSATGCSSLITALDEELTLAGQEIEDYLFNTKATVRIEQLQNQNMLIRLYKAQQIARTLEAVFEE